MEGSVLNVGVWLVAEAVNRVSGVDLRKRTKSCYVARPILNQTKSMKKRRFRFFLDCGICLWGANPEEGFVGGFSTRILPLSEEIKQQVNLFLREYNSSYNYGCPPYKDWTIEDCKRFNREYRRILDLIVPELGSEFIICIWQLDLTEDENVLDEYYRRGSEFYKERQAMYHPEDDDFTNFMP